MDRSVSVVIPTINGGGTLLRCLASVAEQNYPGLQIVLVDNASTDDSVKRALELHPQIRLVANNQNNGFAQACNQGAHVADGKYLLFLNDDALLGRSALQHLVDAAERSPYEILQPVVLDADDAVKSAGFLFTKTGFLWNRQAIPSTEPYPAFTAQGACMLIVRRTFEMLKGFNESYFAYFEEADLCWRARMAGVEVGVTPAAAVFHEGGATTRRVLEPRRIHYLGFRNRLRSLVGNLSPLSLAAVLPLHLLGCLGAAVTFALVGRITIMISVLQALSWPVRHPRLMTQQRRVAQSQRTLRDSEIFRPDLIEKLSARQALQLLSGTLFRWKQAED